MVLFRHPSYILGLETFRPYYVCTFTKVFHRFYFPYGSFLTQFLPVSSPLYQFLALSDTRSVLKDLERV